MQIVSIEVAHDCTLLLYKQLMQTGDVLLLLPLSSVLGFPLYQDTTIKYQRYGLVCKGNPFLENYGEGKS